MVNKLNTCRCCLSEEPSADSLYEFSSEVSVDEDIEGSPKNFIKISECYQQVLNLEHLDDYEENSKICSQCLGDLKFSYLFQKKCLRSDKVYSEIPDYEYEKEENSNVKVEEIESIIEYEQEEFVDEDTNDGFEDDLGHYSEMDSKAETAKAVEMVSPQSRNQYKKRPQKKSAGKIKLETHEDDSEFGYKCKKCDAKFTSKTDAREHLQKSHSNDDKSYNCSVCPKSFKNRYQLILHNRSHTGEKPFECPVCNRCFSMSSNLQKHLDTHSTDKNYVCNICNQNFKTQRSLKFHTVSNHNPENKVKCPQCDKTFVNNSYLKMHMLYHTGEKNYTCSICKSKYYKSSHLKRHIQNVHFKLRLMKCDYCASDFVRKETYKAHIISHHKRSLSEQEFQDVLEKIKRFQPPSLDINMYTLEKQKESGMVDADGEVITEMEMIEEDEMPADESMEGETAYYEETEIYEEDEQ